MSALASTLPLFFFAAAMPLFGARLRRRMREASRANQWRRFLQKETPYEVVRCLGMGREGIVFEVRKAEPEGDSSEPRALKLLDMKSARSLKGRIEMKKRIDAASRARGLEGWSGMPRLHALDIIEADSRAIPYEEMELIRGETLKQAVENGTLEDWPLEARLRAFDELLSGLHELSQEAVNFLHIDADNVMVTEDRQLRLIDLSGFRHVGLTPPRRRRIFRRMARTLLALLADHREGMEKGVFGEEGRKFLEQLELYRTLPKGRRPPPEVELLNIRKFQDRIREVFALEASE